MRARRSIERSGASPALPRRTIDDYMQMLGELAVAESRYRAAIREAPPKGPPKGPPRRADESDDGG